MWLQAVADATKPAVWEACDLLHPPTHRLVTRCTAAVKHISHSLNLWGMGLRFVGPIDGQAAEMYDDNVPFNACLLLPMEPNE